MEHREIYQISEGAFEQLMADIEHEIESAKGGWFMTDSCLTIHQRESHDPNRRNNGGEYDYYKEYTPDGLGIEVRETWSCDFASRSQYGGEETYYDCIISLNGLERMVKLADVTIAARAWLDKKPGCMKKLKTAILSLSE